MTVTLRYLCYCCLRLIKSSCDGQTGLPGLKDAACFDSKIIAEVAQCEATCLQTIMVRLGLTATTQGQTGEGTRVALCRLRSAPG